MSWYLCKSLTKLREQINDAFPNRDKVSDGAVGDTSHKRRKSSHNPDSRGAVRAIDVTHNSEQGLDGNILLNALLKSKDSRLWYLIFNGKIYNRKVNFKPERYTGPNAHKHHVHISVADRPEIYDSGAEWDLVFDLTKPIAKPITKPTVKEISKGAKGDEVRKLQEKLFEMGFLKAADIDADFGTRTQTAVQRFQKSRKLIADGIVGKRTREALGI